MSHPQLDNINIKSVELLATPRQIRAAVPHTALRRAR